MDKPKTELAVPAEASASQVDAALDALVLRSLPPVSLGLALLYLAFAALHVVVLPQSIAVPLAAVAGGTSAALLGLHILLRRYRPSARWAHPIGALGAALVIGNSLLHLYLTGEIRQTTNLMLAVVGCGFLFLSTPWYAGSVTVVVAGWALVLLALPPAPGWLHFGIGLFTATVLSLIAHLTRAKTLRRVTELRIRDRRRQRELEEALTQARDARDRFETLFNSAAEAIFIHDLEGEIFEVNDVACRRLGYRRDELLDMTPADFSTAPETPLMPQPDLVEAVSPALAPGEDGRAVFESAHVTESGETIPVELSSRTIDYDGRPAVLTIARDISERKEAERALRESRERYRTLFEEAPVCLWEEDFSEVKVHIDRLAESGIEDLRSYLKDHPDEVRFCASLVEIERVSRATLDLYGADGIEEFRGGLSAIFGEETWDTFINELMAMARGDTCYEDEVVNYTLGGEKLHVVLTLNVLPGYEDTWARVLVSATDISRRKRAEEALRAYRQNLEQMVQERTRELREAQERLLERQRLEQEVQLAADIQASLMPDEVPDLAGFEFAASALPARHVSGDLYDFVACGEASCHIVVGDIAGKGIPAAMLASAARALVQATAADGTPPGKMMADLRRSLHGDLEQAEMFLTFLCARLDPMSGRLTYASAGHTEPLWCRGEAGMSRLASTGLPLGIFPDSDIEEKTAWLRPGDRVVFYSDGVTEAANPEGERFGMARFQDLVCQEREGTASALRDAVVEAVEAFRAGRPLSDDLTLVVLRALPRETTFRYPADLGHLREATRQVREAVGAYDEELQSQVELAASEILTNLVRHAYGDQSGDVEGRILAGADAIQLEFFDHGRPFDLDAQPPPDRDDPQEGGYGLLVVEGIMDEVEYRAGTPDGNYWRLVKRVPDRAEG